MSKKFLKKHQNFFLMAAILAITFLVLKFGMGGGQRTETDFIVNGADKDVYDLRAEQLERLGAGGLKPLPYDGTGVRAESEE
jgi:hypothetical protein